MEWQKRDQKAEEEKTKETYAAPTKSAVFNKKVKHMDW